MHTHSSPIVSVDIIETYGDMSLEPIHDQGLDRNTDLKKKTIIAQRILDLIKEDMKGYPNLSWMNYIQPLQLKFRVLEEGMSMILFTMNVYEIIIVPCFETVDVFPCRSTSLSLSRSDNNEAPLFLEHSEGSFTHEAM